MSRRLVGYMQWLGFTAQSFNAGNRRRAAAGGATVATTQRSDFFDPTNADAKRQRDMIAFEELQQLLDWISSGGEIGVFDATNSTRERRRQVLERCKQHPSHPAVIFVESICDDPCVIETNIRQKIANSPDYRGVPMDEALADLHQRIANYEMAYETIDDSEELSYIKVINMCNKIVCRGLQGNTAHAIAGFLMSIHLYQRPIWLVRAGNAQDAAGESPAAGQRPSHATPPPRLTRPHSSSVGSFVLPLISSELRGALPGQHTALGCDGAAETVFEDVPSADAAPGSTANAAASSGDEDEPRLPASPPGSPRAVFPQQSASTAALNPEAYADYLLSAISSVAVRDTAVAATATSDDHPAPNAATGLRDCATQTDFAPAVSRDGPGNRVRPRSGSGGIPKPVLPYHLSSRGLTFAERLKNFVCKRAAELAESCATGNACARMRADSISVWKPCPADVLNVIVFTSLQPRAVQTAAPLAGRVRDVIQTNALNMLDVGLCHGMPMDEIRQLMPDEFARWMRDPLRERIPGGESYADLVDRLDPLVIELERISQSPVLVISHLSTLQVVRRGAVRCGGGGGD